MKPGLLFWFLVLFPLWMAVLNATHMKNQKGADQPYEHQRAAN